MRILAAWIAIACMLVIATVVSQKWDDRERRKAQNARDRAKEQITRGFPTPLKHRALEEANRPAVNLHNRTPHQ